MVDGELKRQKVRNEQIKQEEGTVYTDYICTLPTSI